MAQSTIDLPIVNPPDEEPAGRALQRGVQGGSRVGGARPNQGRAAASAHLVSYCGTVFVMNRRHERTLASIFGHPTSGNVPWRDIEALLVAFGAEVTERRGSRVGVRASVRRPAGVPPPASGTRYGQGTVASIREWLRRNGVEP